MKSKRFDSLDILKALSILFVILNHSLTGGEINKIGGAFWIYMAVPIFLIISGFNMFRSIEKRNMAHYSDYFNKAYLRPKLKSILIPWLIAILIITPFQLISNHWTIRDILEEYILRFGFTGGYYIAILLQLYLFFPFIYRGFKRNRYITSIVLIGTQLLFDFMVNIGPIENVADNDQIYRVSILRYLVFILAGMWLAAEIDHLLENTKTYYRLAIFSIVFMILNSYTSIDLELFEQWTRTSLPTIFYAFAIVLLFMKNEQHLSNRFFIDLGRRTYFIYVAQMLYFEIEASEYLRESLATDLNLPLLVPVMIDVMLCVAVGYVFSILYNRASSK